MLDLRDKRILVTGGNGFLGQYVLAELSKNECFNVHAPKRTSADFTSQAITNVVFSSYRPDIVIHLAAKVGGIGANQKYPGTFFRDNLLMGFNLIEASKNYKIEKFIHIGTVCSYPKYTPVPFKEQDLWNGFPEETNAPYGIAKKALGVMLDAYHKEFSLNYDYLIPVNLYGPNDNFDPEFSHVIPALIKKFMDAVDNDQDTVECWGTGMASREFLYVEDAAKAIVESAKTEGFYGWPINLGSGEEILIKDLAELIGKLCSFEGKIVWNSDKPDGQPRRCLDTRVALEQFHWKADTSFNVGLQKTIEWYKDVYKSSRV
jgi:GDP-L-fucose synthase